MRHPGGYLAARSEAKLAQNVLDVNLHCPFGDHQPLGDFPIAHSVSKLASDNLVMGSRSMISDYLSDADAVAAGISKKPIPQQASRRKTSSSGSRWR